MGRPLGYLMSWLQTAHLPEHEFMFEHKEKYKYESPSYEVRKAARDLFLAEAENPENVLMYEYDNVILGFDDEPLEFDV